MLSICIPIYNYNVTELAQNLSNQGGIVNVPVEILCFDDASSEDWKRENSALSGIPLVKYIELADNFGRAAIRNKMSREAKYDYQIFMDCDARVPSEHYLKDYLAHKDIAPVIFGGRTYDAKKPKDKKKILRWVFGKAREVVSPEVRNSKPYKYFMTNNFLVKRDIVAQVPFEETIVGYGHEDTMFAQDLKKQNIKIAHINNPLVHIGLEDNEEFIDKTKNGVKNLAQLIKQGKIDEDNKLFATYQKIKRLGLIWLVKFYIEMRLPKINWSLQSTKPQLFYFDLFKLYLLINAMK